MPRRATEARAARDADAVTLAANLRPQDLAEVEALRGPGSALAAIREGIAASLWCDAIEVDGELAAIVGLVPYQSAVLGDTGVPWMLGTPAVDRCGGVLIRLTPAYIARMLADFPRLFNIVDARNTRAVRWLQRAGFHLSPAVPAGPTGALFHPFEMDLRHV